MTINSLLSKLKQKFPDFEWSIPPKVALGVLTTNRAFVLAKQEKKNPIELANQLKLELENFLQTIDENLEVSTAGPYLNIDLKNSYWQQALLKPAKPSLEKIDQSFVIDMFHPNVGKKMHVGHIRSGNLGEAMRRILSLKYEKVISDSYLGDWGIQFSYTTWGILNLPKLELEFSTIDLEKEAIPDLIDKFYKIYVKMNQLIEDKPEIRDECKANSKLLEKGLQNELETEGETKKFNFLHNLYQKIVQISLTQFVEAEDYLNLNKNPDWLEVPKTLINQDTIARIKGKTGAHLTNSSHIDGKFDLTLGESFYISFLKEFEYFVENGIATEEEGAIYVDLEEYKLGRCYLISSEGYSLYHSRDIICRIVYSGLFGFDKAITFADLRQKFGFLQLFKVLEILIEKDIYKDRAFGWLTKEETQQAFQILKKQMAMFEGFGHLSLPEGAMSTRKGKIFEFSKLREMIEKKTETTLSEKSETEITTDLINKISVASLKWIDLHRDREQDVVFDVDQFLKFEGNTGVYQLYTIARLGTILQKSDQGLLKIKDIDISTLNQTELEILKETFTREYTLEQITQNYKPHLLCNYLFSLASKINGWYAKYSVSNETDENRKNTMLAFCQYLINHLKQSLELLAIEPVEKL